MKIYSLQEENDKLKAKRGYATQPTSGNPFEVRRVEQKTMTGQQQAKRPAQQRPARVPQPSTRMPQQGGQLPRKPVARRNSGSLRWLIWIVFLFIFFSSGLFETCSRF